MITLDVKSELPKGIKWTNEFTKQLPYSAANALNAAVQGSRYISGSQQKSALKALEQSSKRYLHRPKPSISKGWRATRATKRNLQTLILPKDKPIPFRNRYLSGSILGGDRSTPKKWEVAFANHPKARGMPSNVNFVPTKAARKAKLIDTAGSLKKSKVEDLYNAVGNSGRTGSNIFIGTPRTPPSRPPGIYRRERRENLRALFIAEPNVSYRSIFPAQSVVEKPLQKNFGRYLRRELIKNVKREMKMGKADLRGGILW